MTIIPNTERKPFSVNDLHPEMRAPILAMIDITSTAVLRSGKAAHYRFKPFEGYRSPVRQMHLLTVDKTTKAGPWKSPHQYGLAVDFACILVDQNLIRDAWTWPKDADWQWLKSLAQRVGLDIPIEWDRGHVQHPDWRSIRALMR